MSAPFPATIPELDVESLDASLAFYVDGLGFEVVTERPEERFAYLRREDVHLMLEEADGPGRRFRTAPLERPFGRGLNLQLRASAVRELYEAVLASELPVLLPIEERWYRQGPEDVGLRQFVVVDPDGYLLRFVESVGTRPDAGNAS